MSVLKFDIRSLETAAGDGKVNFELDKLSSYKEAFAKGVVEVAPDEIVLTGAGPAWLHMALWHEAHGRVAKGRIFFEAPGMKYSAVPVGEATGDGTSVVDNKIIIKIGDLEAPGDDGRTNFDMGKVVEYQKKALGMVPAFSPGVEFPEFEVILTGAGPIWLFLALTAALHSRGGKVIYSAPNAPRVLIIDHN